jgi:sec-independent protein translocase protein TatB
MFDLGWSELLVIGAVALVVLGPKELPNALRTVSNLSRTARKLAGEFQSGVNEIVREAELEDARKAAQGLGKGSISKAIERTIDPTGELKSSVTGVEKELKDVRPASPVGPVQPALASPAPAPTTTSAPAPAPAPASPEAAQQTETPEAAPAEAKV